MRGCGHQFVKYILTERKILDGIHAKGGRKKLVYSGRIIYHRDRDEDDRLVSQDVRGWWVVGGISGRATRITT